MGYTVDPINALIADHVITENTKEIFIGLGETVYVPKLNKTFKHTSSVKYNCDQCELLKTNYCSVINYKSNCYSNIIPFCCMTEVS